jgi:hypothetical protein
MLEKVNAEFYISGTRVLLCGMAGFAKKFMDLH